MADVTSDSDMKEAQLQSEVRDMKLKEEQEQEQEANMDTIPVAGSVKKEYQTAASGSGTSTPRGIKRQSESGSPIRGESKSKSPVKKEDQDTKIGGDVELKLEANEAPKLIRKSSQLVKKRAAPLFLDYADKTVEATSSFTVLPECVYANKHMGTTEPGLECECAEIWDAQTQTNLACGDDSDCINRWTKMECFGYECPCGAECQNRRFQQKQWADVNVIQTEQKGYGLRTNANLKPGDFIFEYIGEVIGENSFRKRMQLYDEEGIKHFYFMSLSKGEFVDATKKGNLGRFCNHSCNPNCYVDKWVVGDKLRMGIFAERKIQAGEELVFNYNVDRYGAEPQPCYCGEPNCTGYIGGKTQTERGTKLSNAITEALGIDDADAWDTATAKKPLRKKKASEDDEEYVNNIEPRGLDEEGVNKVMSALMQCKEKWIAVKLLKRIQRADDEKVRNQVIRFHGYRILKTVMSNFIDDVNVCLQVLDVLNKMPRLTRNKIQDSKIEETVQQLVDNEDERVTAQSRSLLEGWAKLEIGYRIPRMKRDPNTTAVRKAERVDRRDSERRRSRTRSRSRSPGRIQAPTGPRSSAPQRATSYYQGPRPPPRFRPPPPSGPLPSGWFEAHDTNGRLYYYNSAGATTWQRPTNQPSGAPPPPPPQSVTDQQMISELIKNIVADKVEPVKQASAAATPADTPKKDRQEDKWRSLPEEKQKKMYEATLQPQIMHVVGKYKQKLDREDLKRWAKEFAKNLVDSDFKKGRVEDPSKISDKQVKTVRKLAQDFFEKAVKKKELADKKRAEKKVKKDDNEDRSPEGSPPATANSPMDKDDVDVELFGDEVEGPEATIADSSSNATFKRRLDDLTNGEDEVSILKRQRTEADNNPPPPPPPPPPPSDAMLADLMDTEPNGLAANEDVSGSFTHEAISAVHNATFGDKQTEVNEDIGFSFKGAASRPGSAHGHLRSAVVTQTATPPTTGSPDQEEAEKEARRQNFSGMNPERMRQLGLFDGASD